MAEIGVYRGQFAERVLKSCNSMHTYYMVDPWRHLEDWNKPANKADHELNEYLQETLARTAFAADKRVVLRGTTAEVSHSIPDGTLDFVYVDGDHTLRGITIDLIRIFSKVKTGGFIGGDDFCRSIWQHSPRYEPTLVCPFVVFFAEAVEATVHALPHSQFLIHKRDPPAYSFVDHTGKYATLGLREQCRPRKVMRRIAVTGLRSLRSLARALWPAARIDNR